MLRNKALIFLLPFMVALVVLTAYQYGYLGAQTRVAALKREEDRKARTLAGYMALIGERPEMENRIASLKEARKAEGAKLIEGQTLSVAAAALQDTVKGIVAGRGGKISSERTGKPEGLGKFTMITASIDATLPDTRALSDILYSLETRTPYLVVRELDIRIRNLNKPKELSMKLDVSALTGGR